MPRSGRVPAWQRPPGVSVAQGSPWPRRAHAAPGRPAPRISSAKPEYRACPWRRPPALPPPCRPRRRTARQSAANLLSMSISGRPPAGHCQRRCRPAMPVPNRTSDNRRTLRQAARATATSGARAGVSSAGRVAARATAGSLATAGTPPISGRVAWAPASAASAAGLSRGVFLVIGCNIQYRDTPTGSHRFDPAHPRAADRQGPLPCRSPDGLSPSPVAAVSRRQAAARRYQSSARLRPFDGSVGVSRCCSGEFAPREGPVPIDGMDPGLRRDGHGEQRVHACERSARPPIGEVGLARGNRRGP